MVIIETEQKIFILVHFTFEALQSITNSLQNFSCGYQTSQYRKG